MELNFSFNFTVKFKKNYIVPRHNTRQGISHTQDVHGLQLKNQRIYWCRLNQCFSIAGPRSGTGAWQGRERFSWNLSF